LIEANMAHDDTMVRLHSGNMAEQVILVFCYECESYMELCRVAHVHDNGALCDECNCEITSDLLYHCKNCKSLQSEDSSNDPGYDLCLECGFANSKGVKSDHQEPSNTFSLDIVRAERMPVDSEDSSSESFAPIANANAPHRVEGADVTRQKVFVASAANDNNFQYTARSASVLAEILRGRGCIVNVDTIAATTINGIRINGYLIYSQILELQREDLHQLDTLDTMIASATLSGDLDRLEELQVQRSEFQYVLVRSHQAAKMRSEFSSLGFGSAQIDNLRLLLLTPLSMKEIQTNGKQVGEEVVKAATTLLMRGPTNGKAFTIMHAGSINHWILVTFSERQSDRLLFWDSLCGDPTPHVLQEILRLYKDKVKRVRGGKIRITCLPVQRQSRESNLCLFFAVAHAEAYLRDPAPLLLEFDESQMRAHLSKCLCENDMKKFPLKGHLSRARGSPKNLYI